MKLSWEIIKGCENFPFLSKLGAQNDVKGYENFCMAEGVRGMKFSNVKKINEHETHRTATKRSASAPR